VANTPGAFESGDWDSGRQAWHVIVWNVTRVHLAQNSRSRLFKVGRGQFASQHSELLPHTSLFWAARLTLGITNGSAGESQARCQPTTSVLLLNELNVRPSRPKPPQAG
jgi:hypothetical protein